MTTLNNKQLLLYRRVDDAERGRHLVAARPLERGSLIAAERPLLALQSLENVAYNQVCHGCKAFVGGPDANLLKRRRRRRRQQQQQISCESAAAEEDNEDKRQKDNDEDNEAYSIVPCRKACGHVYCSTECEADTWVAHHCCLCTGDCTSNDDPLVQFKQYCVETNEILLLVAEWWVAQHIAMANQQQSWDTFNTYTDFVMEPWWDVVTADLRQQPGGFGEAAVLQQQLRKICSNAAELLNKALTAADCTSIPPITAHDVAVRIGACEQNAMGIRQRNPLCRDIFDLSLRQRRHVEIINCLEETGFIGNDENDEGSEDNDGVAPDSGEAKDESNRGESRLEIEEEWDYSVDEIALFLANLYIDEDGSVRDLAAEASDTDVEGIEQEKRNGDDFDILFPPLDGTAMYSIACKMNHSCDPNVIVVYKSRTEWGSQNPLTAFCVALRDIPEGEELTISYIDAEEPYKNRKAALANYGFQCRCTKCQKENPGADVTTDDTTIEDEDGLFGTDSDSDEEKGVSASMDADGETMLQKRLNRFDTIGNHSKFGTIPLNCLGPVSAFILQTAKSIVSNRGKMDDNIAWELLEQCMEGIQARDFCLCKIVGCDLEATLFMILKTEGQWPSSHYREAYWCGALTSAVGYIHEYNFLEALMVVDKGFILGLPREDKRLSNFIDFIELHASPMFVGPHPPAVSVIIPDYRKQALSALVQEEGLSQPIRFPVTELGEAPTAEAFQREYLAQSRPVVIRMFASDWPAALKWRHLSFFARNHGHRLVPIELGCMMANSMNEDVMSLRRFIESYLVSSTVKDCWSLSDSVEQESRIAYLAQHPLLMQIPSLYEDLKMQNELCGPKGPTHVYVWFGTGGTRTPLHFDTYDNLFVQLVGSKYVRMYNPEETPKLYVSRRSAFGLQGNMSDVDCEREDWTQHPYAQSASYTEVLLLPGDCLFIPGKTWHYVRSLSTSISVNYWC